MFSKKISTAALLMFIIASIVAFGCSEDTNYDQRAVVYVMSINENAPYLSDVLEQGDSVYYTPPPDFVIKYVDDYVTEDYVKVIFENRPYNGIVDPRFSLGDVMVTGYDVEFVNLGGGNAPVASFSGTTSILVEANSIVEAWVLLVPFSAKNSLALDTLKYTAYEIMAQANITFHGHEVQTENETHFPASLTVNFADPLTVGKE
jgi:hypothetical protein